MSRNIGGTLSMAAMAQLYGRREQHRPTDGETLQAEIRRLHDAGLKSHDIAASLHIGVSAVLQALRRDA